MTANDVGQWQRVNVTATDVSTGTTTTSSTADDVPTYYYTPPTQGVVLDQKVLVGLTLVLGIVAGVVLILVIDRYSSKK